MNIREWVTENYIKKGKSQTDAADDLSLKQNALNQYMKLKRFPGLAVQQRLERLCDGLDITKWRNDYLTEQNERDK